MTDTLPLPAEKYKVVEETIGGMPMIAVMAPDGITRIDFRDFAEADNFCYFLNEAISIGIERGLEMAAVLADKRGHSYCEDSWYSCPKSSDGCSNEGGGKECTCGNEHFASSIRALKTLNAPKEDK